jgi:hypothetical protein
VGSVNYADGVKAADGRAWRGVHSVTWGDEVVARFPNAYAALDYLLDVYAVLTEDPGELVKPLALYRERTHEPLVYVDDERGWWYRPRGWGCRPLLIDTRAA